MRSSSAALREVPRANALDPITLEVIRNGVVSACDQIDANMTRTAFSPYIYEYKDYAVGIVSAAGELVAQSTGGMPVFVADAIGMAVRDGLAIYGRERFFPGDVVVCNHAAVQGQHLNNTVMYAPIFAGSALIGFFAINAHWIDIGGSAIGSSSMLSTDIFMEGLQLRTVKMWTKGERVDDIYRIIENNTRFPVELMGDIEAQLGGILLGSELTARLAGKYGVPMFLEAIATILDDSEAATRARIRAMRDGVYTAESIFDSDGSGRTEGRRLPIKVRVVIDGDEMTVDYSEIADQVTGAINSGRFGGGVTTARVAFKYLVAIDEAANEGTFRPLKLILPDGKLVSASPTAAMSNYSKPFPTIIDTIVRALEDALPERVTGAHFGTFCGTSFRGTRDGKFFNCHDSGHGGWGACATHDGAGPFRTMAHGDTRIIPIELQESMYPFLVEEFCLRQDSAGAGTYRGGLGFQKRYRVLAPCSLTIDYDRIVTPPWGVHGGKAARSGGVTVVRSDSGASERIYKVEGYPLRTGDLVLTETGGGGGYGPPEERSPALIARDLTRGYVSREAAERDYGEFTVRAAMQGGASEKGGR